MSNKNTTWRILIQDEMDDHGDSFENVISSIASMEGVSEWLDIEFYAGFGGKNGCSFTLWTKTRVYFPLCYDGLEWVGSVPRNPSNEITAHPGG